jgi:hypothetical protein
VKLVEMVEGIPQFHVCNQATWLLEGKEEEIIAEDWRKWGEVGQAEGGEMRYKLRVIGYRLRVTPAPSLWPLPC